MTWFRSTYNAEKMNDIIHDLYQMYTEEQLNKY